MGEELFIQNAAFLERLYAQYVRDPSSVSKEWCKYFEEFSQENDFDLLTKYRKEGYKHARTNILSEPLEPIGLNTRLDEIYCNTHTIEIDHIKNEEQKLWIEEELFQREVLNEDKEYTLSILLKVDLFENYLHKKFPGAKRFSIEGLESSILSLDLAINEFAKLDVKEITVGMAHRGRLSFLSTVMRKRYARIFAEFNESSIDINEIDMAGDVKYHLGMSQDLLMAGKKIHISLLSNSSHLESINPIALGKSRAKQDLLEDNERKKVVTILVHGDASVAGQGVVYETLGLSKLDGYNSGNTLHVILNNQIGFTALPEETRSWEGPGEVMKLVGAPIFRANAYDPESVLKVTRVAVEFMSKFSCDAVLEIVGYRKYGHNEMDEPRYTQPDMYRKIDELSSVFESYREKLISSGLLDNTRVENDMKEFTELLDKEMDSSKTLKQEADLLKSHWEGIQIQVQEKAVTGISKKQVDELSKKVFVLKKGMHPKLEKLMKGRKEFSTKKVDWAIAEALALASVLLDGYNVRLSGQDVRRGTFSHRHGTMYFEDGTQHVPLQDIGPGKFEIVNSHLSEYGVLGYEYGYSLASPENLVIWEAQFGDFANGAQVIIDQYIVSSTKKWLRLSGIVLLLPHGHEGQGAEHSSGRVERFLQLAACNNIKVANCTTPASFFHLLRLQVKSNFRRPLIVMTPKSLLRHEEVVSDVEELEGSFEKILLDDISKKKSKRVLICSGKIYYDLLAERNKNERNDTVIIRLEQLYPFPEIELSEKLKQYRSSEIVFVQEEHKNQGAYYFCLPNIEKILKTLKMKHKELLYVGRDESSTSAVGYMSVHGLEQDKLVKRAYE